MSDHGDVAVEVSGLWKKFHRGERHDSLRDFIPSITRRLTGRAPARDVLADGDFWALRDINFQVRQGQALGIIGPNGAGKSTMLKTLSRILRPTRGRCRMRGRVGALIEVAAGFHMDLTGRENIDLQGAIMGMRRDEIRRKLDSIVDFAGIESFIDTPVKRYSSGMNARLGFAIAAHLEPDILVIDEVLSVGDMAFQRKCVDRMNAFKQEGVAIVFVSHNMQAVSSLCDQALFLKSAVCDIGPVQDVIGSYLEGEHVGGAAIPGASIEVQSARLVFPDGSPVAATIPGTALRLEVTLLFREPLSEATLGFVVHRSTDGLVVYDGNFQIEELGLPLARSGEAHCFVFDFHAHLTRGQYHLELNVLHNASYRHVIRVKPIALLRIDESRTYAGVADLGVVARRLPAPGSPSPD